MTIRPFTDKSQRENIPLFNSFSSMLKNPKKDDFIILMIILILLDDGCRDKELIFMLAFLFFADKLDLLEKNLHYFL